MPRTYNDSSSEVNISKQALKPLCRNLAPSLTQDADPLSPPDRTHAFAACERDLWLLIPTIRRS